jgi:hypothetical protein
MPARGRRIEQLRSAKRPEGLVHRCRPDFQVLGEGLGAPAAVGRVDEALEDLSFAIAAEQPVAQLLLAAPAGSVVRHGRPREILWFNHRLDAIAEAGLRLEQMTEERCPVCGALAEHHQHAHSEEQVSPSDISASCRAEASKITTLLQDLRSTQRANAAELDELALRRTARAAELSRIDAELGDALRPKVAAAALAFRKAEVQRQRAERAVELLQRERELQELLEAASVQAPTQRDKHTSSAVSIAEADPFARVAESLLRAWHFPDLDRVAFSEADQDLVISGRSRGSHGKGVRAITHAAFVLALLRHSLDADLPSPGVVVIDSPLVVYREPDPEEGTFPIALKNYFYKSIAESFGDAQVLILENDAPQAALDTEANIITFTKTASGRHGFIP